jgi:hypothetical protein
MATLDRLNELTNQYNDYLITDKYKLRISKATGGNKLVKIYRKGGRDIIMSATKKELEIFLKGMLYVITNIKSIKL